MDAAEYISWVGPHLKKLTETGYLTAKNLESESKTPISWRRPDNGLHINMGPLDKGGFGSVWDVSILPL
jgi:hypothetical protein